MALEASIVERLQELRKWQMDQQDRLLKQQEEQRELLTIEQERMYEALGLSPKNIIEDESIIDQMSVSKFKGQIKKLPDTKEYGINKNELHSTHYLENNNGVISLDDDTSSVDSEQSSNMELTVPIVSLKSMTRDQISYPVPCLNLDDLEHKDISETPRRFRKEHFDFSEENNERLSSDKLAQSMLIDDMPVPSPKKDFTTLLEEKLKNIDEYDANANKNLDTEKRVKRPFLKKGTGLARYRKNPTANPTQKTVKSPAASTNVQINKSQKSNSKTIPTHGYLRSKKTNQISRKAKSTAKVAQNKLILKNVSLPANKVCSKPLPHSTDNSPMSNGKSDNRDQFYQSADEPSNSDIDLSKLETKMFELMEEKAENSSFCSTSSAVMAFMQQSTPSKLKCIFQNLSSNRQKINGAVCQDNGSSNKILHSLKRNRKNQWSPIGKVQETVVRRDIGLPKWNSGPFVNGNMQKIEIPQNKTQISKKINPNTDCELLNLSCSTQIDTASNDSDHNSVNNSEENNPTEFDDKDEANASIHVRFAEHNEYKTYGLTDTSTMSADSQSVTICPDEKTWSDHSTDSESSDLEVLPLKPESPIQSRSDETSPSIQPSDAYNYTNFCTTNQLPIAAHFENTDYDDRNTVDQSTASQNSLFSDSEETDYDEDNAITHLEGTVGKVLNSDHLKEVVLSKSISSSINDQPESELQSQMSDDTHDTIFKSELLKNRLLELEREIDIFRKENAALSQQRQKLHDDHRQLQAELKMKAENLDQDRNQMERGIQEEKKRIAREKAALENRLRDAREKSLETKKERQQVQNLREQLEQLREEMNEKENRWQAAQARQRSQIRVSQMENVKLKQEIKRLQETKRGNVKLTRSTNASNTQAIHRINKQLDSHRGALQNCESRLLDEQVQTIIDVDKKNHDTNNIIVYESSRKSNESTSNKRYLYENLLQEASIEYHDDDVELANNSENTEKTNVAKIADAENDLQITRDFGKIEISTEQVPAPTIEPLKETNLAKNYDKSPQIIQRPNEKLHSHTTQGSYQQFIHQVIESRNAAKQQINSGFKQYQQNYPDEKKYLYDQVRTQRATVPDNGVVNKTKETKLSIPGENRSKLVFPSDPELTPREGHEKQLPQPPENITPRPDLIHVSHLSNIPIQNEQSPVKVNIREVNHPDGHTEYWYPNGNVKRVYPDRNITKMIYYNGDVRETNTDGCVKYFYAATNTWHTTHPDGFEVLEFPK